MPVKKWKDDFVFQAYELAKSGETDATVAHQLGVRGDTVKQWRSRKPMFRLALRTARRKRKSSGETLQEYIFEHLSPELRDVWKQLTRWEKAATGPARIQALLADKGRRVKQHLFIHALIARNFNPSRAMKLVGVSFDTVRTWQEKDPEFSKLLDEVHYHRKNFLEDHLFQSVEAGDTSAIVFANKTLNRDRGYQESVDLNMSGGMRQPFSVEDLLDELSTSAKKEVLAAIRRRQPND